MNETIVWESSWDAPILPPFGTGTQLHVTPGLHVFLLRLPGPILLNSWSPSSARYIRIAVLTPYVQQKELLKSVLADAKLQAGRRSMEVSPANPKELCGQSCFK